MKINFFLIIYLIFLIGIFSILPRIFLPKNQLGLEKIFSIQRGQSFFEISQNLEKEGLIKDKFYFNFYLISTGNYKKLQTGEYLLSSSMIIPEIARKIVAGDVVKIKITIPEGFTIKQIEEKLYPKLTRTFLVNLRVADFKREFSFLENTPPAASLEGFLFPDTYQFFYSETSAEIVKKMLENFDKKLTEELKEKINRQGKTIFEIVTMASMLEKEVKTLEDKKLVSGILWKRLKNGIPLQVDATINYITGEKTTQISKEETQIDSPYNTYKYLGLPLGPISNPGLDSILAAIYPEESQFWYYLSTPDGKTIFSKTLEEHNFAKAKYLK